MTILAMMVGALIATTSGQNNISQGYGQRISALYVAEAGVADAISQLNTDPSWAPATYVQGMENGLGRYTIEFATGSSPLTHESVNNLAGAAAVNGPRGDLTVPPGTAEMVVTANVRGITRQLGVLLTRGVGVNATLPLIVSGKIYLKDGVTVSGITSLTDDTPVESGIHSNSIEDAADIILWESAAEDQATITGTVSTSSTNSSAINMTGGAGSYSSAGETLAAGTQAFPSVDVVTEVDSNVGAATPIVPITGIPTVVSGGNHSYAGGTIHGDVILDNATLYITDDVIINGSITGNGSIYVKGDTTFQGDTKILAVDDQNIAVHSSGNVTLKGFDGNEFLENVAAGDAAFRAYYDDTQLALGDLQALIQDPYSAWGWNETGNDDVERARRTLGQVGASGGSLHPGTTNSETFKKMADHLEANYPGDRSAEFLAEKFHELDRFYGGGPTRADRSR